MKKTIIILMVFFMIPFAYAGMPEVFPGITPDMGVLYKIDVFLDEMKVKSAESNYDKAKIRIEIAEERAAEMKKMDEEGKEEYKEQAKEQHKKNIHEIDILTDEMDDDNEKNALQEKLLLHVRTLDELGDEESYELANKVFFTNQIKISINNRRPITSIEDEIDKGKIKIKEVE